ncbi:MAG: hypothetical protein HOC41_03465 [Candidatus Marinimicrobia bacterium]|jgi:uncharacterized metal-binding protein|nr:hypothetical protein [Candidatus Neomarinimicrobiota bacterium]MBT3946303.1 hypothetical protein [Candidatus Neomarinimicrobiota bacterium]MBT4155374.1 hypothetical protein [Candidatus Neomarinimicrobiota bacterium]MBT4554724.1 hypothetical protein [Candidatus Neomarinimicrobiota bacterium]MBT4753158.1 hypothetical protein [Candidatus Neomarinimicrobiota bacterium]
MGLKTIPFREVEDRAKNMYEAVAAMSGQARTELEERILSKAIQDHQQEDLDVFDEVDEITPETYVEKEKVTTIAINKFLDGEVTWRKTKPV